MSAHLCMHNMHPDLGLQAAYSLQSISAIWNKETYVPGEGKGLA